MAKLIFLLDGNAIKEYALDRERMTIGRRASNDIHVDNLAISGEHAVIVTMGEESTLEDLNSTNGTLVNAKKIKKQMLKHGDAIGLGKYQLKYLNDATVVHQQPNGFADTMLTQPQAAANTADSMTEEDSAVGIIQDAPQEALDDKPVPEVATSETQEPAVTEDEPSSEAEALEPRLKVLSGENAGSALLLDKSMVKVGQPGEQVAVVTKRQDGYFITHVAGDDFPIINGQPIGAQAYALSNHDEIEVLGVKMEFCLD